MKGATMFRRSLDHNLEIRDFEPEDAEPAFAVVDRNRAYLREWLPWVDQTRSTQDLARFIDRTIAQNRAGNGPQAGIWLNGAFAGSIGCHPIDWANRSCSIGYWLDASRQAKGTMTRCCIAMLDHLFEELRLHRVEIRCGATNYRSCAIPKRLGFRQEGLAREAEWVSGRWVDLSVWAMLDREWGDPLVARLRSEFR
jgi:ribosomal-protein-serine acetyltransferase